MYAIPALIKKIVRGEKTRGNMTRDEARWLFGEMLEERVSELQIGALLAGLQRKGEAPEELAGFLDAAERSTMHLHSSTDLPSTTAPPLVAHCGCTNGKSHYFLSSVGAAMVAAATGIQVMVCARSGDETEFPMTEIDVFRAMDIPIARNPHKAEEFLRLLSVCVAEQRFFHPRLAYLASLRIPLGMGTLVQSAEKFICPVRPTAMLAGSFSLTHLRLLAEAAAISFDFPVYLLQERDGATDVLPTTPTKGLLVNGGAISDWSFAPEHVRVARQSEESLPALTASQTARFTEEILRGKMGGPYRDMVLYNAALLIHAAIPTQPLPACANLARASLDMGGACSLLEKLQKAGKKTAE